MVFPISTPNYTKRYEEKLEIGILPNNITERLNFEPETYNQEALTIASNNPSIRTTANIQDFIPETSSQQRNMNGQTEAVSKIDELNYYSPHFAYDIKTANDYKKPIAYKNLHRHPKEKSTVNKNGYLEIIRKHPGKGPTETFIIYYHQVIF